MSRPRAFVELFAGTASVTLRLLGCAQPPCGYMGSKRRLAPDILATLGIHAGAGTGGVLLCDAGPWGQAWDVMLAPGGFAAVAAVLRSWSERDPVDLWESLAAAGPSSDAHERAASFLWLQGRSASCVPVWWEEGEAIMSGAGPINPRTGERYSVDKTRRAVHAAGNAWAGTAIPGSATPRRLASSTGSGAGCQKRTPKGAGGLWYPETVAKRLEAIAALPWPAARVVRAHPSPADVVAWLGTEDLDGAVVYLDPPYVGCTPYAVGCPRDEVVRLARAYDAASATVIVSEAESLPELAEWWTVDLRSTRKPEWLTMNREPVRVPGEQLALWGAA